MADLKRPLLELPATGWVRKYRVRAHGVATDEALAPLSRGITVEGERFQPMQVTIDRVQGQNTWLTVGLREGKNREIRRALSAVGLEVNRLIRISYGPFQLGDLARGAVEENPAKDPARSAWHHAHADGSGRARHRRRRRAAAR